MITYIIQKGINTNNLLIDNYTLNKIKGIMLRITNKDRILKQYYFIEDVKLYTDVLFFGRNKVKSRIKAILENIGLKIIPDTFKNKEILLSNDLITLNLNKLDYIGLF